MEETLVAQNADCVLTATATYQLAGPLRLLCRVHNRQSFPLYLCNRLYELGDPAGSGEPTLRTHPDLVHIQVEPLGVRLDKAIMDLSFREGIRALDIPHLSEVLPDQTLEFSFEVAVPLQPYRTYGQRPGPAPATLLPVWLTLGYFRGVPALTAALTPAPASGSGAYALDYLQSRQEQLLTVGPFATPLPVLNATPSAASTPPPPVAPEQWTPWS